ncbi:2-acylglycerol O-acyltransferase 2-A-like [Phymastichus coffea]|uniref:2-acylglycerol O-acyltransferase 2-A-like n=1 Tax=Phymastichus coffea TaxID=108790 RepID=UPI00273C3A2D|nr:2-acylglycerol O-acyltransferase 2-A-like [Phymastichus coffea]XP_058810786.1 2-acylglycerol O-acyltransferase 2-A-like [Phymastichus coffea]
MRLLGLEFAPMNVPLERRLQTVAACAWIIVTAFGGLISWFVTAAALIFGTIWMRLLMIAYLLFAYYDQDTRLTGGRSKWITTKFRNLAWWRYFCNYFPIKLVKTVDLDPSKNYLFCSFPHGLLSTGVTAAFSTNGLDCAKVFPGLDFRLVTLDTHFQTPLFREYVLNFGVCSCDERSINYLLSTPTTQNDGPTEDPVQGRVVIIIVGGAAEAFKCKPRTYHILVKRRKGFVRIALKTGTPLVPVFSFGETDLYDQVNNPEGSLLRKCQEFVKKVTGIAPVVPWGRGFFQYSFGLIPNRRPVTVLVGAPLEVPKIEEPTKEQVNEYHAKFTDKLVELFETHKSKYLQDSDKLSLILED